jgi:hypothetical protein
VPLCRGVPAALRWTHLQHKLLHDAMTSGANRAADWWILALCTVARVTFKAAWAPAVSVWSAVTAAVQPADVAAALRSVAVDIADFALAMIPQAAQTAISNYAAAASASAFATPAVANAVAAVLAAAGWASTHGGPVARWLLANGPTAHIAAANFLLFADRSPSRSDGFSSFSAACFLISVAIAAFKPWVDQIAPYTLRPKKEGMMERAQDVFMAFLAARKPWSASRFAESGAARRVATYLATGLSETDDDDCDLQLCLRHADDAPVQGGGPTAHARAASSRAARLTKQQQQQQQQGAAAAAASDSEQQRRRRSSGPLYASPLADLSAAGTLGKIHGGASPGLDARLCIQLAATSALNAALCIVRWRNYCDGASLYRVVGTEVVLRAAVSLCEYAVARAFA